MIRTTIFAVAALGLAVVSPVNAAEMTLVRTSRPVTEIEAAGGAPLGGMVHDFYATSDADLLCLATSFSQWAYQHPYGSDNAAPDAELVAYFPAIEADSFFSMPSSTLVLGGGFTETGDEKVWADLNNDGPMTDFLFGRLTTTEPGSFAGFFALRGQETYIEMPFSFTLPGASGPFTETIYVTGTEPIQPTPPEQPLPEVPTQPEEETPPAPHPLVITLSPAEQLRALQADSAERSLEPNGDFLTMRESLFQNLAGREVAIRAQLAVPEPAAWTIAAMGLPLLIRRRSM